jgi:hypothetical protein
MEKASWTILIPTLAILVVFAFTPFVSLASTQNPAFNRGGGVPSSCPTGTVCSTNWSGFAVTAPTGSVSNVEGSWIVPAVSRSRGSTYSSYWVGIDGYSSSTVE